MMAGNKNGARGCDTATPLRRADASGAKDLGDSTTPDPFPSESNTPDTCAEGCDMGKAPAFQFYAADFSDGTDYMSAVEVGIYIRLLASSWTKGPLPKDTRKLASIARVTTEEFEAAWASSVSEKWTNIPDGYVNERMERQRQELAEFTALQSEKGKQGAERRWGKDGRGNASAMAGAMPAPIPDDSSSVFGLQSSSSDSDLQSSTISPVTEQQGRYVGDALADAWNSLTTSPLSKCHGLSADRKRKSALRQKEATITEWREIITRVNVSDFCRGKNDRSWTANFDWLLRPGTRLKVLEGQFDNREQVDPTDAAYARLSQAMGWES